jgi:hypothetical protein
LKLKLDENLGNRSAAMLREAGHDVRTVGDAALCGADDESLLQVCQRQKRGLVMLDLDFGNPLRFRPRDFAGIAVPRLPRRPSFRHLQNAVQILMAALAGATLTTVSSRSK